MSQFSSLAGELLSRELGSADSTVLYTTQRRQDAILEGEEHFLDLTECIVRQTSIAASNATAEYNIMSSGTFGGSTDFVRMAGQGPEYRLRSSNSTAAGSTTYVAGKDFTQTTVERLNREIPGWRDSTGADKPSYWYLRSDGGSLLFGMYPPPTIGTSEVGTLTIPYIPRLSGSTASTSEPFTVNSTVRVDLRPYHRATVHFGAHELLKLKRDYEQSDRQLQKFVGYVTRYLNQARPKSDRRVTLARNYFQDARGSRRWITQEGIDPFRD